MRRSPAAHHRRGPPARLGAAGPGLGRAVLHPARARSPSSTALVTRYDVLLPHAATTAARSWPASSSAACSVPRLPCCSPPRALPAAGSCPSLVVSQALPVFALAPLLVLWLGYGMASKVAMAVLIIFFPVTTAFFDGLRRTEPGWLELARMMNARPRAVLWQIRVPAALPAMASGLRVAAAVAPIGARDRRVGRLQRRARLPDAALQRPHAGRPDVRGPPHPGRHGAGLLARSTTSARRLVRWQPENLATKETR